MTDPVRFSLHRSAVAGVPLRELVDRFGTPLFVYDADTIRARIRGLSKFDAIRYAQKANSNPEILRLCREQGALVDAVSAGECLGALRAGYLPETDPPGVVYTADIFDRASLDVVAEHSIPVNCGSPDMIEQYAERVGSAARGITLRVNPGFGHGHSQKVNTGGELSKHGIWHEDLEPCVRRAQAVGLRVTGIHVHVGSGVDMEHLAKVAAEVCVLARRAGPDVQVVSGGGGLTVPYRDGDPRIDPDAYFEVWDRERRALSHDLGQAIKLEIEPGRFLVAESGFLVTEVRAIKSMGNKRYCLVDAGFNNLARPVLYGAYHPISLDVPRGRALGDYVVAGPLCESGDVFTQSSGGILETRELPEPRVGDLLTIECTGAYAFSMSSNYNSKPFAEEVLVDEGQPRSIRARQSLEAL